MGTARRVVFLDFKIGKAMVPTHLFALEIGHHKYWPSKIGRQKKWSQEKMVARKIAVHCVAKPLLIGASQP